MTSVDVDWTQQDGLELFKTLADLQARLADAQFGLEHLWYDSIATIILLGLLVGAVWFVIIVLMGLACFDMWDRQGKGRKVDLVVWSSLLITIALFAISIPAIVEMHEIHLIKDIAMIEAQIDVIEEAIANRFG